MKTEVSQQHKVFRLGMAGMPVREKRGEERGRKCRGSRSRGAMYEFGFIVVKRREHWV